MITDVNAVRLEELLVWLNDKRFYAEIVDARDYDALVSVVRGYDVVLNVSSVADKLPSMKAALVRGANYIDSGATPAREQLLLDEGFKKKGLLGIIHMYYSPGLDNVLAHYAIERLDRIESIDLRWAVVDIVLHSEHSRQLYWGFTFRDIMLHHFKLPSKCLKNGKILELPPRTEPEMFIFRGPIGTTEVAGLPGESLDWAHMYYPEIPNITFKEALGVEILDKRCSFLAGLGFNRAELINVNGQMISPWKVLQYLANNQAPETKRAPDIRHGGGAVVRGTKDGQKI